MRRSLLGWVAALILAVGGGAYAWFWFSGGSGEPSTELTTPTIAAEQSSTSTVDASTTTGDAPGTTVPAREVSFVMDQTRSTASFELDEELRGSPKRVVGTTDQVAGQVVVDPADLSSAEFSEIVINARTFETDSGQRDRAIRGPIILNSASDEFEFITFTVTSVAGFQGAATVGDQFEFTITGNLTVKGTSNEETFEVSATFVDADTIEGNASTTISRDAYGIGIPSVSSVANVSDEVLLRLDFVLSRG